MTRGNDAPLAPARTHGVYWNMSLPPWSPTQQVHALLLLHQLSNRLVREAQARTLHGNRQLGGSLIALGRRGLPGVITEMTQWPALRLTRCRDTLATAIEQYNAGSIAAEQTAATATAMLRQGERFTEAALAVEPVAQLVTLVDAGETTLACHALHATLLRLRQAHLDEDASAALAWDEAIGVLDQAMSSLGLVLIDSQTRIAPATAITRRHVATEQASSYLPTPIDEESDVVTGGSSALRRRARQG
jgi:hypothetical protein